MRQGSRPSLLSWRILLATRSLLAPMAALSVSAPTVLPCWGGGSSAERWTPLDSLRCSC